MQADMTLTDASRYDFKPTGKEADLTIAVNIVFIAPNPSATPTAVDH